MIESIQDIPKIFYNDLVVTPQLAQSILNDGRLEEAHRRKINQQTIAYLRKQIRDGEFEDGTVLIFVVLNGKTYLANGRHRVIACLQMKYTATFTAIVVPIENRKNIPKKIFNMNFNFKDVASQLTDLPGCESLFHASTIF